MKTAPLNSIMLSGILISSLSILFSSVQLHKQIDMIRANKLRLTIIFFCRYKVLLPIYKASISTLLLNFLLPSVSRGFDQLFSAIEAKCLNNSFLSSLELLILDFRMICSTWKGRLDIMPSDRVIPLEIVIFLEWAYEVMFSNPSCISGVIS